MQGKSSFWSRHELAASAFYVLLYLPSLWYRAFDVVSSLLGNMNGFWYLGQKGDNMQPWKQKPGTDPLTCILPTLLMICKCLILWINPFVLGIPRIFPEPTLEWYKVEIQIWFWFIFLFYSVLPSCPLSLAYENFKLGPSFGIDWWTRLTFRDSTPALNIFRIWEKLQ